MRFKDKICLITFSNNADHQNVIYSMFKALQGEAEVYTIGIQNPKSKIAVYSDHNFYFDCPMRPGIERKTFRIDTLLKIAKVIKKKNIKYLYFESLHIWNAALMLLCPKCIKIEAIHDVIPHDGNIAMDVCNYVTSKLADHVILRNRKYKELLSKKVKISIDKISCLEPWREFPEEEESKHTGVFLCFGRIRRYKGFDRLIEVIRKTPAIKYRVVGEPDEESIQLVDTLKTLKNVHVVDMEVSDQQMRQEFINADWVVLPYKDATQSGVILDAYRYSRPVIAFDVGAISEQIDNNCTGFLVPDGNIDVFADKIKLAAKMNPEELDQFSARAYYYGYSKYSASSAANRFLEILSKVEK